MTIKGLYADQWRNMKTQGECDALISYALANGYTDLYVQCGVDDDYTRRVPAQIDYLSYICANKGSLKIHAWLRGLRLWRKFYKLDTYPDSYLFSDGEIIYLDPVNPAVQNVIAARFGYYSGYDIDGMLIDNLWYQNASLGSGTEEQKTTALDNVIQLARALTPVLGVTCMRDGDTAVKINDCDRWYDEGWIDYVSPFTPYFDLANTVQRFSGKAYPIRYTVWSKADGERIGEDYIRFSYANS